MMHTILAGKDAKRKTARATRRPSSPPPSVSPEIMRQPDHHNAKTILEIYLNEGFPEKVFF
jgi:hypothetical protein